MDKHVPEEPTAHSVGIPAENPPLEPLSGMNERRRPPRRGRGPRPQSRSAAESSGEPNPYREETQDSATPDTASDGEGHGAEIASPPPHLPVPLPIPLSLPPVPPTTGVNAETPIGPPNGGVPGIVGGGGSAIPPGPRTEGQNFGGRNQNGRRHRRNRGRGGSGGGAVGGTGSGGSGMAQGQAPRREHQPPQQPPIVVVATGETRGWFDPARDGGFIRRSNNSYLAESGDAYVPPHVVRQLGLRKSDLVDATVGRDQRGRTTAVEIRTINEIDPTTAGRRPDFQALPAAYPERKLVMETGRPAKGGHELTRRAIDLIAPIGYGQRALIVAPARAGKTTLLHAITEGIAVNHPNATLIILLVDERPEEVSEAISWGVGEVVASSFDQPAERHVEVTEMVLERARRLIEIGKDVVIVLDSLTRMARAHNTAERGTGRTLSGGLDATAMAKPKAFFGSARAIPASSGGGSLTIIATALVETGSRMDDVIFEEFKGTGNCEIKLDRSLAEKRIYPAIDIATSGTRREEKLFRPDQLEGVYTLRRGLSQMPPQSAMEWLIKRIGATQSNNALLAGL